MIITISQSYELHTSGKTANNIPAEINQMTRNNIQKEASTESINKLYR